MINLRALRQLLFCFSGWRAQCLTAGTVIYAACGESADVTVKLRSCSDSYRQSAGLGYRLFLEFITPL